MTKTIILRLTKRTLISILFIIVLLILMIGISIPISRLLSPNGLLPVKIPKLLTIDNINLITMTDRGLLTNKQLVIENGRIISINPAGTPVTETGQRIDARNFYITPGLIDMHVHLYDRKYLLSNLAYGVTSVRVLRGESRFLQWKKEIKNKQWLASTLYVSSPILDGKQAHALNQKTTTPAEGRWQVRQAKKKGYDLIKVYGYLDTEVFNAIVDEAKKQNIPVVKHGPHPIGDNPWQGLKGLQSLEHVEDIFQGPLNYEFDYHKLKTIIAKLKLLNVPVTPTLATFNHLTQLSVHKQAFIDTLELDYLNPFYRDLLKEFSVERWLSVSDKHAAYNQKELVFLLDIVKELHFQQVTLLIGSDAGTMFTLPGISMHDEMELMKQAGLSNFDILQAATINAAKVLSIEDQYGSIDIGQIADMVMVKTNPLDNLSLLRNPEAVIKQGQWLSKASLVSLKKSAKNHGSYYWGVIALLDDILERAIKFTAR